MALATAQKLKLKEGNTIFAINAPAHYDNALGSLPKGAKITDTTKTPDQVHWFVKNKAQMEKDLKSVLSLLKDQAICWIFFPKGSSKIQTDLTRDSAWALLQNREVQMITLISFDDIWSAFGVRQKIQTEKKKEQKAKINPVLDYVDSKTKTVKLPPDVAVVFRDKKPLLDYFNSLAFTHRKEYIEWIVSAKKEQTRNERMGKMVEMLENKWKNPSNR